MTTDLVKRANLAEIDEHRTKAVEHYRQAMEHIKLGNQAATLACPSAVNMGSFTLSCEITNGLAYKPRDFADDAQAYLDAYIWRHVLRATSLADILDATARKELEQSLEKDTPPADFETVAATLQALVANSGHMVQRGVVELFRHLSNHHRTNDAFKIGEKLIMSSVFDHAGDSYWQPLNHYSGQMDRLTDLERTLYILSGETPPEQNANIRQQIYAHQKENGYGNRELETKYLRIRWFKNGNAHVWIKQAGLVDQINSIIANYCGDVIADAA